jgi:hypothetical protein
MTTKAAILHDLGASVGFTRSMCHSISGSYLAKTASKSPRSCASTMPRTISTFSRDIAYSSSPAAARASAWLGYMRAHTASASRKRLR